jgi:hypothetical protein
MGIKLIGVSYPVNIYKPAKPARSLEFAREFRVEYVENQETGGG